MTIYTCNICSKSFKSPRSLQSHINWHNPDTYKNRSTNENYIAAKKASIQTLRDKQKLVEVAYNNDPIRCINCNSPLTFNQRNGKFCSKSCSVIITNSQRGPTTDQTKEKISIGLLKFNKDNPNARKSLYHNRPKTYTKIIKKECTACHKLFYSPKNDLKITCSPECARKNSTYRKIVIEYVHNDEIILLESKWELAIAEWLTENKIQWIRPKHLPWIDSTGKNRRYFPDFYLPDYDLYLDPKNDYQIKIGLEKLNYIQSNHNLIYGRVDYLKSEIINWMDRFDSNKQPPEPKSGVLPIAPLSTK